MVALSLADGWLAGEPLLVRPARGRGGGASRGYPFAGRAWMCRPGPVDMNILPVQAVRPLAGQSGAAEDEGGIAAWSAAPGAVVRDGPRRRVGGPGTGR